MRDSIHRLLSNLHGVFDKDPGRALAFRFRFLTGGMRWWIADGRLRTEVDAVDWVEGLSYLDGTWTLNGDRTLSGEYLAPPAGLDIALEGHTIGSLVSMLAAQPGYSVVYVDDSMLSVSARALMTGGGDQAESNGDHVHAFRSLLWSLLDAYSGPLDIADADIAAALRQAYLHSAEAEWLDLWGGYFGVRREAGEADARYVERIVREVLRPRNNAIAIQNAVAELTGHNVRLREPWREIFTLNESALSDTHHLQDGNFYTWNVFQPIYQSSPSPLDRDRILRVIHRNRPAGVLVVGDQTQPATMHGIANLAWVCGARKTAIYHFGHSHYRTDVLSSSLTLSDGRHDMPAQFWWRNHGTVGLRFGADPLGMFTPPYWEASGWKAKPWTSGGVRMVVTQH